MRACSGHPPRYYIKRGVKIDLDELLQNRPGSVIALDPWENCVVVEPYPTEMMADCDFIAGMISENP